MPEAVVSRMPIERAAWKLCPLNVEWIAMPTAIPIGVVSVNSAAPSHGRSDEEGTGRSESRAPIPRPSKNWWKTKTIKSDTKAELLATPSVRPTMKESASTSDGRRVKWCQ